MSKPPGRKPAAERRTGVRTVLDTPERRRVHEGTCGITMTGVREGAGDEDAITLQLEYSLMKTQELRVLAVQFLCFLEETMGEGFVTSCLHRYAIEMGKAVEPSATDAKTAILHLRGQARAPLREGQTEETPVPSNEQAPTREPTIATAERLARAMEEAGAGTAIVARARQGYYDEFFAPEGVTFPILQLIYDALKEPGLGGPFVKRVQAGEFDATAEEMDAWAASEEGMDTMRQVAEDYARRLAAQPIQRATLHRQPRRPHRPTQD